jgi:hypothetical protein
MNGFLVLLRASSDDYPLSLHATLEAAEEAARKAEDDPRGALAELEERLGELPWSPTLLGVDIVEFDRDLPVQLKCLMDI